MLNIEDLSIAFSSHQNLNYVVDHLNLTINEQETVALVGESGCGKSLTAHSILRLLSPSQVSYPTGKILFNGQNLLTAEEKTLRELRGNKISMIFQEPMVSLNPLHTVEKQLYEVLNLHQGMKRSIARNEIITYLDRVGIKDAKSRLNSYPHQLSGGERQRVMIAMAILNHPKLLIADEPTTALDVSVQAQIMSLLKELKNELHMSMLFISHNLSIVQKMADKVAVMKDGQIIEFNSRHRLFLIPQHDYTKVLLNSSTKGQPVPLPNVPANLLKINALNVEIKNNNGFFRKKRKKILNDVYFTIHQGECVGIVGESGSGKSTMALAILRLIASKGSILFYGSDLNKLNQRQLLPFRHKIQVVFQDPFSSLNPKFSVEEIIKEGLVIHKRLNEQQMEQSVIDIMNEVGLDPATRYRYPSEFSGGQRQRIAIARALILQPELLILDEPTSSLDRTVQLQIVDLLKSLQKKYQLSYLFISHDLSVIHSLCHQVVVMKEGNVIEQGQRDQIFNEPKDPYTKMLLSFFVREKALKQRKLSHHREGKVVQSKDPNKKNWSDALFTKQKKE